MACVPECPGRCKMPIKLKLTVKETELNCILCQIGIFGKHAQR